MASVKALLKCIGVDAGGRVSILRDLFGFSRGRVPAEQAADAVAEVSLIRLVRDLQGPHLHLNVIRVGFDALPEAARPAAVEKLDYAIFRIRQIYRPAGLGIGRVEHLVVDARESGGRDDIGSFDEFDAMSTEWTVPNDGIDIFVVRNVSADFIGVSFVGGSCDKGRGRDGVLGGHISRGSEGVARTFAHEVGHFLGRRHNHEDECPTSAEDLLNLMAQTKCVDSVREAVLLTGPQASTMRGHCSIRNGC